jgi:hypothetical protein
MLYIIRKKKKYIFEIYEYLSTMLIEVKSCRESKPGQNLRIMVFPCGIGNLDSLGPSLPQFPPHPSPPHPSLTPPHPHIPPSPPPITYLAQGLLRCAYNTNILLEKHNTERIICPPSSKSSRTYIL